MRRWHSGYCNRLQPGFSRVRVPSSAFIFKMNTKAFLKLRLKRRYRLNLIKYFLFSLGFILLILGIFWMIFPVPFGFVLVIVGLVFLSPVPFFKHILNYIEKRDKTNMLVNLDGRVRRFEEPYLRGDLGEDLGE